MSQTTYQYGETVDITIRGARVNSFGEPGLFIDIPGDLRGVRLPVADGKVNAAIEVKLVQPADGAAMPGDLWTDHTGTRYVAYVQQRNYGPDEVMLHNGQSAYRMAELCEHRFRMSLVYRDPAPVMNGTSCEDITGENEPAPAAKSEPDYWGRGTDTHEVNADGEFVGVHARAVGGRGDEEAAWAECTCGTTYAGFDTLAEAAALLDEHIANANAARSETAVVTA